MSYARDDDDADYMQFERPEKPASKKTGDKAKRRAAIPVLPEPPRYNPDEMMDMRGGITRLDEAIVNMRVDNVPFEEIARILSLPSATDAYQRCVRALAKTHPREDWETTRQLEIARAEQLLRRSMAMAAAEFFVDAENPDELIPNEDRLRWHQQAGQDLALHATISGAKAPTRVEITPTDQEYEALVTEVLRSRGHSEPAEFDILSLDQIPNVEDAEIVDGEMDR
jgi:hypothetical protein